MGRRNQQNIVRIGRVEYSVQHEDDKQVRLRITQDNPVFALVDLLDVAKHYSTEDVNIHSEGRMGGYCETCEYVTSEVEIVVRKKE